MIDTKTSLEIKKLDWEDIVTDGWNCRLQSNSFPMTYEIYSTKDLPNGLPKEGYVVKPSFGIGDFRDDIFDTIEDAKRGAQLKFEKAVKELLV